MILNSQPSQFTLNDEGQILWQQDASNPVPGEVVAGIVKGPEILRPDVELVEGDAVKGEDKTALTDFLRSWLHTHIDTVLEPLVALKAEGPEGPVQEIAAQLFEAMGILPRENLESLIAQLDQETRRDLRAKKIKLGPVLVFLPDLNKPAAVRMRGLLWCLWNDKPLPAKVPSDGMVSFKMEDKDADAVFHRVIGYPIYGPRSIRIDMLDRVINAVYDGAKDGKFKAKHEMAEWLGSSIEDLYLVLEAMGHKKISDPADQQEEAKEKAEGEASEKTEKPKPEEKPELATFRLKKGKAFEAEKPAAAKKPERKKDFKKPSQKPVKKKAPKKEPRIMQAGAPENPEDSPFAILGQLKAKSDGK